MQSKLTKQIFKSVFDDEQELLYALIKLHCPKGIELDPMYFKGNFYKHIDRPKHIFDINPLFPYVKKADAQNLPLNSNSIQSMILDPPFMFGIHGKTKKYYSSATHGIFKDFDELYLMYESIIKEANRVLKRGGILFFKCQDYTDSSTTMVHCLVYYLATLNGFYAKDLAILNLSKGKVANPNLKQRHLRKIHSYFWVFQKIKRGEGGNSSQP